MNRQICTIFLVITNVLASFCQISDDFDSEILSQIWEGDRSSFTITADHQLQLDAEASGVSSLYAPFMGDKEMSWNISFAMNFNPSTSNQLRIYLFRNNPSIDNDDALFLEIGQSGSDDGLHLYQRINGEEELIASGSEGIFAEIPSAELIISLTEDDICAVSIISPFLGCITEDILVPVVPMTLGATLYFGWTCTYTSTRKDKFFFDDIYVGPYEEDISPPALLGVSFSEDSFTFSFDEPILSDVDLTISPEVPFQSIALKSGITISGDFQEGQEYIFSFQNVSDLSGNLLDTSISHFISRSPVIGDLLINEILFNPRGSGADYVEIVNTSEDMLSLNDVLISNLDKDQFFPIQKGQIAAGGIIVLTSDKENIISNYPNHNAMSIYQQSIPTWNNDEDNVAIVLHDEVLDEFNYDENMHLVFLDNEDGVSLERISLEVNSADINNWTSASATSAYGTPGLPNSSVTEIGSSNHISLVDKIISPNGDGDRDVLEVGYTLDTSGYIATASIYNDSGSLIDHVFRNQSLSTQGSFSWNPQGQSSKSATTGLYILHIELFNPSGAKFQEKLSFGISDYLR